MLERTVKIFISSTFRDMHAERDYLIKHIFPKIKQQALQKGIHVVDIDLRWGVTEAEAQSGKALEICLEEIDQARPFFLCLLGHRYGWVPEQLEVSNQPKFDWLAPLSGNHSITHLEIIHGLFHHPIFNQRSFFFFREIESGLIPPPLKPLIMESKPESQTQLVNLKQAIQAYYEKKSSHHIKTYHPAFAGIRLNQDQVQTLLEYFPIPSDFNQVRAVLNEDSLIPLPALSSLSPTVIETLCGIGQPYFNRLEEFGHQVLHVIEQAIDEEFPEATLSLNPDDIEKAKQSTFYRSRVRHFFGRNEELKQVSQLLEKSHAVMITGISGSGKSAFLAKCVQMLEDHQKQCIVVFCGISESSSSIDSLLEYLIKQVYQMKPSMYQLAIPHSYAERKKLFRELLVKWKECELYICLDGLNQLTSEYQPELLDWVVWDAPQVTFLFSALEGIFLDQASRFDIPILELPSLSKEDAKDLVRFYLMEYRKILDSSQQHDLFQKQEITKPLYGVVVSELLRTFPRFEDLSHYIKALPETVEGLFSLLIDDVLVEFPTLFAKDTLSWLALAKFGLMESDLIRLHEYKHQHRFPAFLYAQFFYYISAYLTNVGSEDQGLIRPFHAQFTNAIMIAFHSDEEYRKQQYSTLASLGEEEVRLQLPYLSLSMQYMAVYLHYAEEQDRLVRLFCEISLLPEGHQYYDIYRTWLFEVANTDVSQRNHLMERVFQGLLKTANLKHFAMYMLRDYASDLSAAGYTKMAYYVSKWYVYVAEQLRDENQAHILASAYNQMSYYSLLLTTQEESLQYASKAHNILEEVCKKEPTPTALYELAEIKTSMADVFMKKGNKDHELQLREEAIGLFKKLESEHPHQVDVRVARMNQEAIVLDHSTSMNQKLVQKRAKQLLEEVTSFSEDYPENISLAVLRIRLMRDQVNRLVSNQDSRYEPEMFAVLECSKQAIRRNPEHLLFQHQQSLILQDLIIAFHKQSRFEEAAFLFRQAQEHVRVCLSKDPMNQEYQMNWLYLTRLQGDFYYYQQHYEDASIAYRSSFDFYLEIQISNPLFRVSTLVLEQLIDVLLSSLYYNQSFQEILTVYETLLKQPWSKEISLLAWARIHYMRALAYYSLQDRIQYQQAGIKVLESHKELSNDELSPSAMETILTHLESFIQIEIEGQYFLEALHLGFRLMGLKPPSSVITPFCQSLERYFALVQKHCLPMIPLMSDQEWIHFIRLILSSSHYALLKPSINPLIYAHNIVFTLYDKALRGRLSSVHDTYFRANIMRLSAIIQTYQGRQVDGLFSQAQAAYEELMEDLSQTFIYEEYLIVLTIRVTFYHSGNHGMMKQIQEAVMDYIQNQKGSPYLSNWLTEHSS